MYLMKMIFLFLKINIIIMITLIYFFFIVNIKFKLFSTALPTPPHLWMVIIISFALLNEYNWFKTVIVNFLTNQSISISDTPCQFTKADTIQIEPPHTTRSPQLKALQWKHILIEKQLKTIAHLVRLWLCWDCVKYESQALPDYWMECALCILRFAFAYQFSFNYA